MYDPLLRQYYVIIFVVCNPRFDDGLMTSTFDEYFHVMRYFVHSSI